MQRHGGEAAESAIMANERSFRIAVYVDWEGNDDPQQPLGELSDFVKEIAIDRALESSAPSELLLVEGSSAAELSMTLGGELDGMSLPHVFSRFNTKSPLHGKRTVGAEITYEVIVDTPIGPFRYPQFIGIVRTIAPDRRENTVEITCLDRVEQLRQPIQLPLWGMSDWAVNWGESDSQVAWSHSVMDIALRLCDVGVGPKRPATRVDMNAASNSIDTMQLFITGNGCYFPAVGWMDSPNAGAFPNRGAEMYTDKGVKHPDLPEDADPPLTFAAQNRANATFRVPPTEGDEGWIRYFIADRAKVSAYGTYYFGLTLNDPDHARQHSETRILTDYDGPWAKTFNILVGGGNIWARKQYHTASGGRTDYESRKVAIPAGATSADVHVQWNNRTNQVNVSCGGNSTGMHTVGPTSGYVLYAAKYNVLGRVTLSPITPISDIYVVTRAETTSTKLDSTDVCYRQPRYAAALDRGLNRFSHIPDSQPTVAWDVISEIASAELGAVFWDEEGIFRFWNRETLDAMQEESVRSITLDDMENIGWIDNLDSVRNIYNLNATRKRAFLSTSVYSTSDINEFIVPANQNSTFSVWADDMVNPQPAMLTRHWSGDSVPGGLPGWETGRHGYVAQFLHDNSGVLGPGWYEENALPNPIIICGYDQYGYLTVRVDNFAKYPIRFASGLHSDNRNNDSPAFNVHGTKLEEAANYGFVSRNDVSLSTYGPKTYDLSGQWYQDTYTQNNMVATLMQRTAEPIPTTDEITIPADPRLQLGDTVTLHDAQGFGSDIKVQILGISRQWGLNEAFTDTLTVEVCKPPSGQFVEPPPGAGQEKPRNNLCPNPKLQNNGDGWFGTNASITSGNNFPNANRGVFSSRRVICPQSVLPESHGSYTYSAYMIPQATMLVRLEMHWYREGQYHSFGGRRTLAVVKDRTERLSICSNPPFAATHAVMDIQYYGPATVSQGMLEKALIVNPGQPQATDPLAYFDGDTEPPKTTWDGTVGNSTSTYTP